jgi:PAS domain S-box-containing protein
MFCVHAGRPHVLAVAAGLTALIALADWQVGLDISLGILYIVPMVLAALAVRKRWLVPMALLCALLRMLFDSPRLPIETVMRFAFATIAYTSAGLFVAAAMRTREEQALRVEAEGQLEALAASSPAGILTVDERGTILAANTAVREVFGISAEAEMRGLSVAPFLPVLSDALALDTGSIPFRTSAQCQGRRANGEAFLADIWFSTYRTAHGRRLAAIVIDSSEEMRTREEQNARQLSRNSRIMASAMLHEVRNLCAAIAAVCANLERRTTALDSDELLGLHHLAAGLGRIAAVELAPSDAPAIESVSLQEVLTDLRIVTEGSWSEAGGTIRWEAAQGQTRVLADRHGLLQVFLNLTQNSWRAVQKRTERELTVSVTETAAKILVRFEDTGGGVAAPEHLFLPFQPGATATGLGLYISKALLRSFGGDLRHEPGRQGAAFVVELPSAERG